MSALQITGIMMFMWACVFNLIGQYRFLARLREIYRRYGGDPNDLKGIRRSWFDVFKVNGREPGQLRVEKQLLWLDVKGFYKRTTPLAIGGVVPFFLGAVFHTHHR